MKFTERKFFKILGICWLLNALAWGFVMISAIDANAQQGQIQDFRLGVNAFHDLLNQPGNGDANIKIRIGPTHTSAFSNWSSGTSDSKGTYKIWPVGSHIEWKDSVATVSSTTSPDLDRSHWSLAVALDVIQWNAVLGKWMRFSLQRSADSQEADWSKIRGFQTGSILPSTFLYTTRNYNGGGNFSSSSTTSFTIPTAGNSATFTLADLGLSLPGGVTTTVGTTSETITIPTTDPTFMTRTLPTGLTLPAGSHVSYYGNTSNYFIYVIATYNSSTGVATGFSTIHLGSGSFSSWTVKTEEFVYVYRTSDENFEHFVGVVTAYNPGTGSITVKCINNVGTNTRTDWTIRLAKQAITPSGASTIDGTQIGANGNYPLGAWITGKFSGTALSLYSKTGPNAVAWRVIYTTGPLSASPPSSVDIDLYHAGSILSDQKSVAFNDLSIEGIAGAEHNFIAVSIPASAGGSTLTYMYSNGTTPYGIQDTFNYEQFVSDGIEYGYNGDAQATGELLFKYYLLGSGHPVNTWPHHNDHTENNLVRNYEVDGVAIKANSFNSIDNPYLYKYKSFTSAKIYQSGTFIHEADAGDFAAYSTTHIFDKYGMRFDASVKWLKDINIDQEYSNMCEVSNVKYEKTKAGSGEIQTRPPAATRTEMTSTFAGQTSYVHLMTDGLAVGQMFTLPTTWRSGLVNNGGGHIETGTGYVKMRPYPWFGGTIPAGTEEKFTGSWYFGNRGTL